MKQRFNVNEVFDIAIQIERNGRDFFLKASGMTQIPEAKLLLAKLAEMEREHEKTFSEIKEKYSISDVETLPDPERLALSYLSAMAEDKIFDNHDNISWKLSKSKSLSDIYRIALGFEKDSVVFFTAIRETVPCETGKKQVDSLIREEISHIAIISRELLVQLAKNQNL